MVDRRRTNEYTRLGFCPAKLSYRMLVGVNYCANGHCISYRMFTRCHIWSFLECCRRGTSAQRGMGHMLHSEQFLESHMAPKFPQSTPNPEPLYCETRRTCSQRNIEESSSSVPRRVCYLWALPLGSCKDRYSIRGFCTNARFLCSYANSHLGRRPGYFHCSGTAWIAESTMASFRIPMDFLRFNFARCRFRGRLCQAWPRNFFSSSSILSYICYLASVGPQQELASSGQYGILH
jgi:hypothetical protein